MATIQDFEERIEKQKAELAKLEAKKKELEKKIRERNRKWRSLVTHSAGESVLSAVGCAWQELDLDALDRFLASHADEVSDMLTAHGSTPEDAKARLDARKKKSQRLCDVSALDALARPKGNLPHLRGTRTRRNEQKDGQAFLASRQV